MSAWPYFKLYSFIYIFKGDVGDEGDATRISILILTMDHMTRGLLVLTNP